MSEDASVVILVVNDDPGTRYFITRVLRAAGWRVDEAATGFEGLAKVQALRPEVVVLDIKLPDLLGYDVCRRIKEDPESAGICIIQTSATFVTAQGKARGLDSGADAYLTQPFEGIELVAMVKSLLRLKRSEAEARQKATMLLQADRRKDEFLAMLGHELRNPLSAILTASALIDRNEVNADEARRFNATIHRQAEHLARLVDDLLDVSRITQGKIQLDLETIDLRDVVGSVLRAQGTEAERRHHRLVVSMPGTPLWVRGDMTRLEQIVGNLLANALKYTSDGGHIHVTLGERGPENAPRVFFRMRDTGIGLAKDSLASIWDLFVQVDSSLARTQSGLGIGLTMVRRLVEMHGGNVEARSDGLGEGTEFTFDLPRAAERLPVSAAVPSPRAGAYRVLLVDDNVDSCELYAFAFERHGHHVTCAHDGHVGLEAAMKERFDLAIVDIGLPTVDGYEVARTLRERLGGMCPYLIALTGYGRPEDKARALEAGFDVHLVKPIDVAEVERLFARVRRAANEEAAAG